MEVREDGWGRRSEWRGLGQVEGRRRRRVGEKEMNGGKEGRWWRKGEKKGEEEALLFISGWVLLSIIIWSWESEFEVLPPIILFPIQSSLRSLGWEAQRWYWPDICLCVCVVGKRQFAGLQEGWLELDVKMMNE